MKKKNILIITHAAGTPEIGPNMRTFYLSKNLVTLGHKVNIVGSGNFHKYQKTPLENRKYTMRDVDGITYHWLPTYNYKKRNFQQVINQFDFIYRSFQKKNIWKEINPDIILVSSPHPFGIFPAIKVAKSCNSKVIFEVRDLWPEIVMELGDLKSWHPYVIMLRSAVKYAYKKADALVSVKQGDLKYLSEEYDVRGELVYIPNGFDNQNVADENFDHTVLNDGSFKVIYTGALSNYYSIGSLIEAAKIIDQSHKDINFIIVGDGEDRERYERLVAKCNLKNFTFLGYHPKKYMLSIIRKSDVAFLGLKDTQVNRHGISTNKLFEYQYAKIPIVASYNTKYDIVEKAACGISVPSESPSLISDAIITLYKKSKEERKEMGNRGYNYLVKNHTFEIITKKYLELFNKILQ